MDEIHLSLQDIENDLIMSDSNHTNSINAIAHDGTYLYTAGDDGQLHLWSRETLSHHNAIELTESNLLSITTDMDYVYVGSSLDDASLHVRRRSAMTPAIILKDEYSSILALTTTKNEIVAGRSNGNIDFWNRHDWEKIASISSKHHIVLSVITDSEYLYAGGIDDFVSVFRLSDFGHVLNLEGHDADVFSLAVDSDFVYSGSGEIWWGGPGSPRPPSFESSIRVWDKNTWTCIKILDGHTDNVNSVQTDDKHVYSVSDDGSLRVYNKTDWTQWVLDCENGPLKALVTDASYIYLGGNGDRIWKIPKAIFQG